MVWLGSHDGRGICEELAENLDMISVEFWENVIEEKEWIFSWNFSHIFPKESDKSQKKNLILTTREDVFRRRPSVIYLDWKTDLIQMWANSGSSDDEITFCIFSEEFQEMLLVDYLQSVTFSEFDFYWSREL